MTTPSCFVIQPFDGGPFDKRYEDTLEPAIKSAGITPYRVDRDEFAVIPIESIEQGIKRADVCLADITTDNPNVWLEVGFALAIQKSVVLVCSSKREKFPFDVQHRSIIRYGTESQSDFVNLASQVTKRLQAVIKTRNEIASIASRPPIANTEGLTGHEMVALVVIASHLEGSLSTDPILREMEGAGYTKIAASLALRSLENKKYVDTSFETDSWGNEYRVFFTTEAGFRWLEANQSKLVLRRETKPPVEGTDSGDIPF